MKIHIVPSLMAAWLAVTPSSPAPAFMKLGDIKGEATEANHRQWSNLEALSVGITRQSITNLAGGVSTQFRADIALGKNLDKSSPKLMELVATGQSVPVLELHLTRQLSDGSQVVYLQYELKNVLISSYSIGGSGPSSSVPAEQLSLNFEEIKVTYNVIDAAGRVQEAVTSTIRSTPTRG